MEHLKHNAPDSRQWRINKKGLPCKYCGSKPILARSGQNGVGWSIQCPTSAKHYYGFEQWVGKCLRKWNLHNDPKVEQKVLPHDPA